MSLVKFVNLTPHPILLHRLVEDREAGTAGYFLIEKIRPEPVSARLAVTTEVVGHLDERGSICGVPLRRSVLGEIVGLPAPEDGVVYITSLLVAAAARRADVVSPDDMVRDGAGAVIGCKAFATHV